MKLISWNVNGIRAVLKKEFLQFVKKEDPDVLCLQETKAHPDQVDKILEQYPYHIWNSAEKKGYSGTAVFSKIKPLNVVLDLPEDIAKKYKVAGDGYGNPNKEGRIIAAEFEHFFLVTVYTPNSKGDLGRLGLRHKQWDPAFLEYMKHMEKKKPVIVCGDLNVAHTPDDLANPKANEGEHGFTKEEREGIQAMIDAGFLDTFRMFTKGNDHYSWWSHWANARKNNVGWRIDYFLASKKLKDKIHEATILDKVMGSDHAPVVLVLK